MRRRIEEMTAKQQAKRFPMKSECVDDDRVYTDEQVEFLIAMDDYKRRHQRPFPTWAEVLRVFKGLGYHKAM